MMTAKNLKLFITLFASALVGLAFLGLTYSALVAEDGALRAASVGLLAGIVAFSLVFIVVLTILDLRK